MTNQILQMERRANKRGVTYIGKLAGCKATVTVGRETRYRTVTKSGSISAAANAGKMQTIRIDVDEYKKHYPDMDVLNLIKCMKKNCRLMEAEE